MTVPDFGGCTWPVDTACLTPQWEEFSPEVQARALALATATLERLTGYRVSNCPITVRPCAPTINHCGLRYYSGGGFAWMTPFNWSGSWVNACGCTGGGCYHGDALAQIKLPAPVGRIEEVKVNGQVLASTDYLLHGNTLLRKNGTWPIRQDLSSSDSELGTFSVTYLNAYPVDALGAYAAGVLAMEYGQACVGNKCRLPTGVTAIARQGVTMQVATGTFPEGMTGIREVDTFIALWNPDGMTQRSKVWSPDIAGSNVQRGLA